MRMRDNFQFLHEHWFRGRIRENAEKLITSGLYERTAW
jgi:hypothetical protein